MAEPLTPERIANFRKTIRLHGAGKETAQLPLTAFVQFLDAAERAAKLAAENERLREAAIRLHRSRCTEDNCVLDGNPEHAAAFATAALEGKA